MCHNRSQTYRKYSRRTRETRNILSPFVVIGDIVVQVIVVRRYDVGIDLGSVQRCSYTHFLAHGMDAMTLIAVWPKLRVKTKTSTFNRQFVFVWVKIVCGLLLTGSPSRLLHFGRSIPSNRAYVPHGSSDTGMKKENEIRILRKTHGSRLMSQINQNVSKF